MNWRISSASCRNAPSPDAACGSAGSLSPPQPDSKLTRRRTAMTADTTRLMLGGYCGTDGLGDLPRNLAGVCPAPEVAGREVGGLTGQSVHRIEGVRSVVAAAR